jgi:hydroxymethylglutaryl-CoA lyase
MGAGGVMNDQVRIVEVGPRDGLQNESQTVETNVKIDLINRLSDTGLQMIEATSFVSPKAIPQLNDADLVLQGIRQKPDVAYPVLVPNYHGLERALQAGAKHIAVFAAASETFSQKNIRSNIQDSLRSYVPVVQEAKDQGLWVRGYISCALGCPYEGKIDPERVLEVTQALLTMGVDEISIGDTIGVGTPKSVRALLKLLSSIIPMEKLALHAHDTYGQALANVYAALEEGIRIVDASVAGLGGCPYAKGATGNVATEDVLYLLEGLGIETGVDYQKLVQVGDFICKALNRRNEAKSGVATLAKQ